MPDTRCCSQAVAFLGSVCTWCTELEKAFSERALCGDRAALAIDKNDLFLPVLPLLEEPGTSPSPDTAASESTLVALPVALGVSESGIQGEEREGSSMSTAKMLSVGDLALFLAEQRRSIAAICASIDVAFSGDRHARERQGAVSDRLFTSREVRVVLMAAHASDVAAQLLDGLDYIEGMLRSQLTAAIGKELTADDFDEYVIHHNKKLFKPEFVPVPFCYAVRRPGHAPDGSLVIECGTRGGSKVRSLRVRMRVLMHVRVSVCACFFSRARARNCQNGVSRENASTRVCKCKLVKRNSPPSHRSPSTPTWRVFLRRHR